MDYRRGQTDEFEMLIPAVDTDMIRLAIVVSHPTQYYSPWFQYLARDKRLTLRVYYLWDFGIRLQQDAKFEHDLQWDIDLLSGYESELVPNVSKNPGTSSFQGLNNPQLSKRLKNWSPDSVLVFGYGWKSLFELPWRFRGCPIILRGDTHNLIQIGKSPIKSALRKFGLTLLFKRYAAFACVGEANRRFYEDYGVPNTKCSIVPHCVDNNRFALQSPLETENWRLKTRTTNNTFTVLFAGKFESKKRPDLLVEAFKAANLDSSQLIMIGSGQLESQLREQAKPLDERVHFCGFINQTQMPVALGAANVLVLPSQGSGETWGLIVNEAMASGTPAIVSDHVGCREDLIIEGKTGWSFEAGNKSGLVKALKLAHDSWRQDQKALSQNARKHIEKFSYGNATDALLGLLAHLRPVNASSFK